MRRILGLLSALILVSSCTSLNQVGHQEDAKMSHLAAEAVHNSRGPQNQPFQPGPLFSHELQAKIAEELKALDGDSRDIPLTLNEAVRAEAEYLLTDARKFMAHSLRRSGRYLPIMKSILQKKGLPPDLAYMVLIESGFRVDAVSPANAVGPWQFIRATGKRYGLRINQWEDERMHPLRATEAAADYLTDLHEMFGCWYLAAAAYNCGEGRILRNLKNNTVKTFWDMREQDLLPGETDRYVPRLLAAIIIAKDPARYGLTDIQPDPIERWDNVVVAQPTDLEMVARLSEVDVDVIRGLNPHLKQWCTPLDSTNYALRVPYGKGASFTAQYARLGKEQKLRRSVHVVRPGESLSVIAGRYGMSTRALKNYNGLKSNTIYKGQKLRLPVDPQIYEARQKEFEQRRQAKSAQRKAEGHRTTYVVKNGDNPWSISRKFDVNWRELASWNNITDVRKLHPGQKLVVYLEDEPSARTTPRPPARAQKKTPTRSAAASSKSAPEPTPASYTVCQGDNLWSIARRFDLTPTELRSRNGLADNHIKPGQVLQITASKETATRKNTAAEAAPTTKNDPATETSTATYRVQPNDTLWKISQRFHVSPETIKKANGLKDSIIQPGDQLTIPVAATHTASSTAGQAEAVSYEVKKGDTVWKIARHFKVEPDQIRTWNHLRDNNIQPGDILTIRSDKI